MKREMPAYGSLRTSSLAHAGSEQIQTYLAFLERLASQVSRGSRLEQHIANCVAAVSGDNFYAR